jgi:hypothetical protein
VSRGRIVLAFVVAPFVFVAIYWAFLISFWGGAGGYLSEGVASLAIGYPIGFVLVLVGGLAILFRRLPPTVELAVFIGAGLAAAVVWVLVLHGRIRRDDYLFFEFCAVGSGIMYPLFVRLAALPRRP